MKTIFKKVTDLVVKSGLNRQELSIIKKVFFSSFALCIISVAGIWGYFKLSVKGTSDMVISSQIKSDISPVQETTLDISANVFTAQSYFNRGKPAQSVPYLQRALQLSHGDAYIRYLLAHSQLEAGLYDQCLAQIATLEKNTIPDSIKESACVLTAKALFYAGQISESTRKLSSCLTEHPGSAEALCFMGVVKTFNSVDSSAARHFFEDAIKRDSSYVEAWYQLGRVEMALHDTFQARKHLLYALELDPLHIKSHARLGMLYYYMGNYTLAENSYRTTLALNEADYNTRYNLGELLYNKGDTAGALKEYTEVLRQKPDHNDANFRVGQICMRNNMYKEAIGYFEKTLQKEPGNIRIILQTAVCYEKLELLPEALALYKRILSINDLHPIAQQKVKMISVQIGKTP
ncbi:MAG TPA: tetratricopeptide repeat protein [Chitinispirillaceae bacterium]|nr:tetratricopeptide repeat protein [Chitinispirillaceae bacterium]